jgi:hypothetical protein
MLRRVRRVRVRDVIAHLFGYEELSVPQIVGLCLLGRFDIDRSTSWLWLPSWVNPCLSWPSRGVPSRIRTCDTGLGIHPQMPLVMSVVVL